MNWQTLLGALLILSALVGPDAAAQTSSGRTVSTAPTPPVTVFRGPPVPPKQVAPPPNLRVMPGSPGSGSASTPTVVRGAPQDQSVK